MIYRVIKWLSYLCISIYKLARLNKAALHNSFLALCKNLQCPPNGPKLSWPSDLPMGSCRDLPEIPQKHTTSTKRKGASTKQREKEIGSMMSKLLFHFCRWESKSCHHLQWSSWQREQSPVQQLIATGASGGTMWGLSHPTVLQVQLRAPKQAGTYAPLPLTGPWLQKHPRVP